jgi:hypothetical protein
MNVDSMIDRYALWATRSPLNYVIGMILPILALALTIAWLLGL